MEVRDWALDDPHGPELDRVREIRGETHARVTDRFDEYFGEA